MRTRTILYSLALLALALPSTIAAQFRSDWHSKLSKTWQVSFFSSTIGEPILREPGPVDAAGQELTVDQSLKVKSGKVSWMYAGPKWGIDLGLVLWSTDLDDFKVRLESVDTATYRNVSMRYVFLDTGVDWAPLPAVPVSLYGVFGMGTETEKYSTYGGGALPNWWGPRDNTSFQYSYGGGVRFYPLHNVGLLAEMRWIPGDLITTYEGRSTTCYYYSYNGVSGNTCGGNSDVKNHTTVASIGAFIVFP